MAFVCVFSVAAPYSVPPASAEENLEDFWGVDYYDSCINLSNEMPVASHK